MFDNNFYLIVRKYGKCLSILLGYIGLSILSKAVFSNTMSLPWEKPVVTIIQSLTGTTAKEVAVISMFTAGAMLVFGGELEDFARRITWLVMAVGLMYSGEGLLKLFNANWAPNAAGGALVQYLVVHQIS